MILSFSDALTFAEQLHRRQTRKGNDIPYIAHLMAVTATVLEWGGDEDTAIAALLARRGRRPGRRAHRIAHPHALRRPGAGLLHCTDSASADPAQKRPWQERKDAYLERLAHADQPAALITAADKLHNITATLRDVRAHGPETLARFNQPDRVIWYDRAVADALEPHAGCVLAELKSATDELASLIEPAQAVSADGRVLAQGRRLRCPPAPAGAAPPAIGSSAISGLWASTRPRAATPK